MSKLSSTSLSVKMLLLIGISALGLALSFGFSFFIISKLKVNGPLYNSIVQGKDIAADILPPPEYIIESYLVLQRLQGETDAGKKQKYVQEFTRLKKEYLERHDYWKKELPQDAIASALTEDSYQPAMAFYKSAEEALIPAILKGDAATAAGIMKSQIDPAYAAHRTHIDKLVELVNKKCARIETEAAGSLKYYTIALIAVNLLIFSIIVAVGTYIARSIIKPLQQGVQFANRIADGDLTQTLSVTGADEIGNLAAALNQMAGNMKRLFAEMADGVKGLSCAATELSAVSVQMNAGAGQTSSSIMEVAAAADQMSGNMLSMAAAVEQGTTNVNSVSVATEEMTSTIDEISRTSARAHLITEQAVTQASQVSEKVSELGRAAMEIGKVTETIAAISAQTNLLALNATIEAARAGVAGKGFTVVASEIKTLAQQTANATEGIKEKIENIQISTRETVQDIDRISQTVLEVNELIGTTAIAIEEQATVIKDIARNIVYAAQGMHEVNTNVAQTTVAAETIAGDISVANTAVAEISSSSREVEQSAGQLAGLARQLKDMTERFKV